MGIAIFLMIIALGIGLLIMNSQAEAAAKELREAQTAYQESLTALKASPMDADVKEETLRKGRVYSNLTRNKQGVTMYDEVALMNDINAACAGAGAPHSTREEPVRTIEGRLAHLQQLRDRNLITSQEFDQRRAEILREV